MKKTHITEYIVRKALVLSVPFLIAGLFSCKKKGDLQPGFTPNGVEEGFVDTYRLSHKTIAEDSILTSKTISHLLGAYKDGVFGSTQTAIFTEFSLGGNFNVSFGQTGDVLVADSVVLSIKYDAEFGPQGSFNLSIHELSEDLDNDNSYYSNQAATYMSTVLFERTINPNLDDSVTVDGVKEVPQLRVPLDISLANKLLNASTSDLLDDPALQAYFHGLALVATMDSKSSGVKSDGIVNTGGMVGLNLTSGVTRMTLYYRNLTQNDTNTFDFVVNSECQRFTNFKHSLTGTEVEKQLNGSYTDSTACYVQAMGGAVTEIDFSSILALNDTGFVLINKGELALPIKEGTTATFGKPARLVIVERDSAGVNRFPDDLGEGVTFYDGALNDDQTAYVFRLTRYLNDVLRGYSKPQLYLLVSGASINGTRVMVNSQHATNPLKLSIYYTKLP